MKSICVLKNSKFEKFNNWKRAKNMAGLNQNGIKLFKEFSERSIQQGCLGNCYLLASV